MNNHIRRLVTASAVVLGLGLTLGLGLFGPAALAGKDKQPVTFFGFDYSTVKMMGTLDFNEPAEIFPGYLDKWNSLWLAEMVEVTEKAIGPVVWSFDSVNGPNHKATADQIIRDDSPGLADKTDLDEAAIKAHLTALDVGNHDSGLGLVVIMDRMVKPSQLGCGFIVYFDIASRTPKVSQRVCKTATGFGFRNYWFRPNKDMLDDMKKLRPE